MNTLNVSLFVLVLLFLIGFIVQTIRLSQERIDRDRIEEHRDELRDIVLASNRRISELEEDTNMLRNEIEVKDKIFKSTTNRNLELIVNERKKIADFELRLESMDYRCSMLESQKNALGRRYGMATIIYPSLPKEVEQTIDMPFEEKLDFFIEREPCIGMFYEIEQMIHYYAKNLNKKDQNKLKAKMDKLERMYAVAREEKYRFSAIEITEIIKSQLARRNTRKEPSLAELCAVRDSWESMPFEVQKHVSIDLIQEFTDYVTATEQGD